MNPSLPIVTPRPMPNRPRLAVFKFTSCDGCQLSLLDCEDELLDLADRVEIGFFREAARLELSGCFDVALVEGSVSTPEQEQEIRNVRARSKFLICLGACASHGGIQALRHLGSAAAALRVVYANPASVAMLEKSLPASDYVKVDLELPGCPINKKQLIHVIASLLAGGRPGLDRHAQCLECKRQGVVCLVVARGMACLGPATSTGCGALCMRHDRGCFGCYGPAQGANAAALARRFGELGLEPAAIARLFRTFYSTAVEFQIGSQSA